MTNKTEDFQLKEEDRDFVSMILVKYAKRMKEMANEVASGEAGTALMRSAERAEALAREINPPVYDSQTPGIHPRMITGMKYPRNTLT
jgi:hypothetical protein